MFIRLPWMGSATLIRYPAAFPVFRRPLVERLRGELSLDWGRFELIFTSHKRLQEEGKLGSMVMAEGGGVA